MLCYVFTMFYCYTEIDTRVLFTLDHGNDKGLLGHSKTICKQGKFARKYIFLKNPVIDRQMVQFGPGHC